MSSPHPRSELRKRCNLLTAAENGQNENLGSELEEANESTAATNEIPSPFSYSNQEANSQLEEQTYMSEQEAQQKLILDECAFQTQNALIKPRMIGIFEFIWMEISRGYSLQNEEDRYAEKRRKVSAFLRIPIELERFSFYGFRQCLDAFCHMFTFLPIRILISLIGCISRRKNWTAADSCDILKLFIIICSSWFMLLVDTSVIYHLVRGQGVIKLYIFYNMLEVADKLFSSFGQDIFDALLWTVSERGRSWRSKFLSSIFHLVVAILYALCHTMLILLQATTLNVAFNSHNQSLLTIMMSNNFVELKGSVFKKFGKPNLFQMSCSDVRERFHTVILLVVVLLRNMTAVNWKLEHLYEMCPDLLMIVIAELIVDWLKHAFITKFNEISALVYRDFTITLAFDVLRSHERESFSDFSDQVSRRMGFVPIPITIMLIRIINQSVDFSSPFSQTFLATVWVSLFFVKVVNGVALHREAVVKVLEYEAHQMAAQCDEFDVDGGDIRRRYLSKSAPNSPRLSLYDFTDVLTQAAKKASAPIIKMKRENETEHCIYDVCKDGTESPPRRTQSMVDFGREGNERADSGNVTFRIGDDVTDDKATASITNESAKTGSASGAREIFASQLQEELANIQAYSLLGDDIKRTCASTSTSDLTTQQNNPNNY